MIHNDDDHFCFLLNLWHNNWLNLQVVMKRVVIILLLFTLVKSVAGQK